MKKINKKGFTLIELLVVIAIIGLLSTLAVVALNNARAKSRDAKRLADVKQMQTALEMCYNEIGFYPDPVNVSSGNALTCSGVTFMAEVPTNPTPGGATYTYTGCTSDGVTCGDAGAVADAVRGSYNLTYTTEGLVNNIDCTAGCTATPAAIH